MYYLLSKLDELISWVKALPVAIGLLMFMVALLVMPGPDKQKKTVKRKELPAPDNWFKEQLGVMAEYLCSGEKYSDSGLMQSGPLQATGRRRRGCVVITIKPSAK